MITYNLNKDTILYHGTICDFEPNDLKLPTWLSIDRDQAHNHICYKYFGQSNGKILTFMTKNKIYCHFIKIDFSLSYKVFRGEI